MKIKFLFLLLIISSCKGNKNEDVLIKDLTKAASIIAKNNNLHLQKVKKYCAPTTSKEDDKKLCEQFANLHLFKETYQKDIIGENAEHEKLNKEFIEKCFSQLDATEKAYITKSFKDSPIMDVSKIEDMNESTSSHALILESEIIIEETYQLLLKDFSKHKPGFDWEIYW